MFLCFSNNNAQQQQCEYDRVDIFSKLKEGKLKKHGSYCGSKAPGLITSESNIMRVVFYSDTSVQKTGFAAVFFSGQYNEHYDLFKFITMFS